MYRPCDRDAPWLAFDGANVVTTFNDEWRFVQGPGVDDPPVGLMRPVTVGSRLLYFITDGSGRQLMVTDSSGKLDVNDVPGPGVARGHWRFAGATAAANPFNGDRQSPPNLPTVALFRNRVYDLQTGRWTQEDPTGIAGGINLYRYNANNPTRYTDPFGLQFCPPSTYEQAVLCAGEMLTPAQGPLEVLGTAVMAPLTITGDATVAVLGLARAATAGRLASEATIAGRLTTAARVIDDAGALRTTTTVARHLSGQRSYIPTQAILETIKGGTRIPDPQGVVGRFMYTAQAAQRTGGKTSVGTLEVLINEIEGVVEHVLFKSAP